jgi:localization factor PodJL
MSAAMRQNVLSGLETLDSETLESAKRAARRLGMSLEEWLSHAIAERATHTLAETPAPRRRVTAPGLDDLDAVTTRLSRMTTPARQTASTPRELDTVLAAANAESERRSRETASKTAAALDSVARWIERAEDRLHETSRVAGERQEKTAALLGNAIDLMTRRLDDIERKVVDGQQPSVLAAMRAVESLEKQIVQISREQSRERDETLESVLKGFEERVATIAEHAAKQAQKSDGADSPEKNQRIEASLKSFEQRFADLAEKIAANVESVARPVSSSPSMQEPPALSRIPSTHPEPQRASLDYSVTHDRRQSDQGLRDVLEFLKKHQTQLEQQIASHESAEALRAAVTPELFRTLQGDISRLSSQVYGAQEASGQEILAALQSDLNRINETLGTLATQDDVTTLETSLIDLSRVLGKVGAGGQDVRELVPALQDLNGEVRRLGDVVTTGIQGHIALDLDAIARKLDMVAQKGIDPLAIQLLDAQLGHVRGVVNTLADPGRVEKLDQQLSELTRNMARIGARQVDPVEFASLRSAVEDVRTSLKSARLSSDSEMLSRYFEGLAHKIDAVSEKVAHADITAIDSQLRSLTQKLEDGPKIPPHDILARIDGLAERLDTLDPRGMQHSVETSLKPIETSLRALSDRLDVPRSADEAQMRALIERLDTLDHALREERSGQAPYSLRAIEDALHHLTRRLDGNSEPDALSDAVLERLDRLEHSLKAQPHPSMAVLQPFEAALRAIAEKLDRSSPQDGFAKAILERLDRLELAIRRPPSQDNAILERLDALQESLRKDTQPPLAEVLNPVQDAIRSLTDRIERAPESPISVDAVLTRLDKLDENLRQPREAGELKSIEDMLRSLAAKLEQAGQPHAPQQAFEALERQIQDLAARLEPRSGTDTELNTLHVAMGELMNRVDGLKGQTADVASQAVRTALETLPAAAPQPEFGFLKRDLADIKARHFETEKRTQTTLGTVHDTLEKVASRLAGLERELAESRKGRGQAGQDVASLASAARRPPVAASSDLHKRLDQERQEQETLARLQADARSRLEGRREESEQSFVSSGQSPLSPPSSSLPLREPIEALLEPGSARPDLNAGAEYPLDRSPDTTQARELKASFIAAARRAAQAAAAEAQAQAMEPPSARRKRAQGETRRSSSLSAFSQGLPAHLAKGLSQVRRTANANKRPILLGLAAVVLAIGALQTGRFLNRPLNMLETTAAITRPAPLAPLPAVATLPETTASTRERISQTFTSPAPLPAVPTPDPAQIVAAPVLSEPSTTGSLGTGLPLGATSAFGGKISDMSGIGDIPQLSGNLATLRRAAVSGEPVAVYDLAVRAAEGRGLQRDLRLAAKLFEKAGAHGMAPAQYRIGNMYEKGLGVPKDVALARVWYQRAAENGNARAMHNLAVLTAEGAGGKPDYAGASEWFRRAAEHGVRDSQFNYAVLLARGLGVKQDLAASHLWFSIAAAQGDEDAAKKRDEVMGRLSKAESLAAKAIFERWRPQPLDPLANDGPVFEMTADAAPREATPRPERDPTRENKDKKSGT